VRICIRGVSFLKIRLADNESLELQRQFEVSQFSWGLRRLLIRSFRSDGNEDRIDILFVDTQYVDLHTRMFVAELRDVTEYSPDEQQANAMRVESGAPEGLAPHDYREHREFLLIDADGSTGKVIARTCQFAKDQLDGNQPGEFNMS
jgi:hypothetical protein